MKILRTKLFFLPGLFLILIVSGAKAQVSGYLGSRLSIGYHFITGFNIDQYRNTNEKGPLFLLKHEGNIDYIIMRRTILGLEGGISKLEYSRLYNSSLKQSINTSSNIGFYYFGADIKAFFASSPLAPVGSYFKVKTGIINYTPDIAFSSSAMIPEYKKSFILPYLGLGYGKMRVIADRIILDLGLECNFLIGYGGPTLPITDGQGDLYQNTQKESAHRIAQACFINYYIGIAGLLGK